MREREVKALHRESKIVETLMLVTPSTRAKQIYRMALSLMRQELEQAANHVLAPKPYDCAGLLENMTEDPDAH